MFDVHLRRFISYIERIVELMLSKQICLFYRYILGSYDGDMDVTHSYEMLCIQKNFQ